MAEPCPLRRCNGHLEIWATGTDAAGHAIDIGQCDVCGKVVELPASPGEGQDALPGLDSR